MQRIIIQPLFISCFFVFVSFGQFNPGNIQNPMPQQRPQNMPQNIPGGSLNPFVNPVGYYYNMGPLYPFGPGTKDIKLMDREAQTGRQIDLFTWFPYYGSKYNYTVLSVHGYLAFANVLEDGLDFLIGEDVPNWPQNPDPAMIATYACRQKQSTAVPGDQTGVYYRLIFRRDMAITTNINQILNNYQKKADYIDFNGDDQLDRIQYDLAQGMVGAMSFRPDAALIVTWQNMSYYQASSAEELQKTATYQTVYMTDRAGQLAYTMINYHSLGFAGGDIYGNMKRGRCKAELNGGNQTGLVLVDPVYSKYPMKLYQMSSVPHIVGGRYMFRVDDIVRRGGCSNLTAGTYRLTIYPDIINMLGDVPIQINGPCMQPYGHPPTLNIANNKPSMCIIKSPAIAECRMNQFYQWGTKSVYLQYNNNKAYIGSIYYVPVGLDPFGLQVDQIADWFKNPPPRTLTVRWYPGNFTDQVGNILNTLELTLYGYKETNDEASQKYTNTLKPICVIAQVQNPIINNNAGLMVENSYSITVPLNPQWVGNGQSDMWTYSFGVLKLGVPVQGGGGANVNAAQQGQGIWSPPVPLQWLWLGTSGAQNQNPEDQSNYIANIASKACIQWFEEEGTQWNFIQDTETNASCPCTLNQAYADLGRYMPHPRCSQRFRNVGCDTYIGAKECFLSAENVNSNFATHYGQVCCYDQDGYLMQTTYASVQPNIIKGPERDPLPYNPGFPQRAYELGTYTFYKQYEAPTLSNYFHDVMPYYFCCKWAQNHCQFFYWRRPSSGCQEYRPAGIATVMGAGHFTTFDSVQYTFEGNGTYVFLHKNSDLYNIRNPTPEVTIEIRLERYPNRLVDFSHRNTYQYELMQPVNASVVTGVAVQEGTSDRVVIMCRKDTRRFKYRTNVLVNDEIRYFDTMKMQRYNGITLYINDVKEGQSEVYVTLLGSRIGMRIRESYAYHIYQQQTFEESMGVLDVTVSIPSEYFIKPDPLSSQIDWHHAVEGLVGTYSNNTNDEFCDPKTNQPQGGYSNDQSAAQWAKLWVVDGVQFQNYFLLMSNDHQEWPEAQLLNPIYKAAPEMDKQDPFYPLYDNDAQQRFDYCMQYPSYEGCPPPATMMDIPTTCQRMKWCIYDYFFLQQKILATLLTSEYSTGKGLRQDMYAARNSCAAINIQYPEYLYIEPARGGYLGGDNVLFQCYQNGWLKGDASYQCRDGQWNKGWQPWCRDRTLENTLRIVAIIFGILLSLAFLAAIFLCCFCFAKSRREQTNKYQTGEPVPKKQPTDFRSSVDPPQKSMLVTSDGPNGYSKLSPMNPPSYDAHLKVQVVGDGSDNSSPSSARGGGNVTSV